MRRILVTVFALALLVLTGCSEAERVSYNLSKQADNFNSIRQLTVINCITGDTLLQMSGKLSITADIDDNQLEIIIENDDGTYQKGFIGLSNNVTYVVTDVVGVDVDKYKFTINYNPNMWFPISAEFID